MKITHQLTTPYACGGVGVQDGKITGGAPIFKKLTGKHIDELPKNYKITKL